MGAARWTYLLILVICQKFLSESKLHIRLQVQLQLMSDVTQAISKPGQQPAIVCFQFAFNIRIQKILGVSVNETAKSLGR